MSVQDPQLSVPPGDPSALRERLVTLACDPRALSIARDRSLRGAEVFTSTGVVEPLARALGGPRQGDA